MERKGPTKGWSSNSLDVANLENQQYLEVTRTISFETCLITFKFPINIKG